MTPAPATRLIDEGDRTFEVTHTPGYSPGSIMLWEASTGILFSGDTVYDGPLVNDAFHSDVDAYIASMKRILELPVRVVHGGHFPSFGGTRYHALIKACLEARGNERIWCDTRVRVLTVNTASYASIRSILEGGLDRVPPGPNRGGLCPNTNICAAPAIARARKGGPMLTNPTLEPMQRLGLRGMAAAYCDLAEHAHELGREEMARTGKRLANSLRAARLRFPEACIEDIDFAAGAWLKAHENLIVSGNTGKTWFGSALGHQA